RLSRAHRRRRRRHPRPARIRRADRLRPAREVRAPRRRSPRRSRMAALGPRRRSPRRDAARAAPGRAPLPPAGHAGDPPPAAAAIPGRAAFPGRPPGRAGRLQRQDGRDAGLVIAARPSMEKVLIVYGSTDGQTAKIASRIADTLRVAECPVELADIRAGAPPLEGFGAVLVGASVRFGRYQRGIEAFARKKRAAIDPGPD